MRGDDLVKDAPLQPVVDTASGLAKKAPPLQPVVDVASGAAKAVPPLSPPASLPANALGAAALRRGLSSAHAEDAAAVDDAPRAPAGKADRAFSLDPSQRWALGTLVALLLVTVVVAYVVLALLVNPRLPANGPRLVLPLVGFLALAPPELLIWVQVGLISLLGALLEVMWGVAYHGFWKKDYDPESVLFSVAKVAQAPFITLVAFGAGVLLLPLDTGFAAPITAAPAALAFLCGYYSADLLDVVHRNFTKLLGKQPAPLVSKPLPKGRVYPLDALLDHPSVAPLLPGDARGAVAALRRHGAATTADLAGMKPQELRRLAQEQGVDPATLESLQDLSEALAAKPTLQEGVAHLRASRPAPATADAADGLARKLDVKGPLR